MEYRDTIGKYDELMRAKSVEYDIEDASRIPVWRWTAPKEDGCAGLFVSGEDELGVSSKAHIEVRAGDTPEGGGCLVEITSKDRGVYGDEERFYEGRRETTVERLHSPEVQRMFRSFGLPALSKLDLKFVREASVGFREDLLARQNPRLKDRGIVR